MSRVYAAGIHDVERSSVPFDFPEEAVARGAGRIVHNGETLSNQAVEQSAFSYVGPANECDDGFGHSFLYLSAIGRGQG
jgi:hypothetical protein